MGGVRYTVMTPPAGRGAIGVVQVNADDAGSMEAFLARAGVRVAPGRPVLGDLLGIDRGIAVRWSPTTVDLFVHGGPAVVRALGRALVRAIEEAGLAAGGFVAGDGHYPEAGDEIEARMLPVLARAASPLAVDLLLDQPARWRRALARRDGMSGTPAADAVTARSLDSPAAQGVSVADGAVLARLVDPPLVVAVGPPNVGKSTLLNRLAGRSVSIVADAPGTTRDHVGAMLDLAGLVVRYLDTPGLLEGATGPDREAIEIARRAAEGADLILACGDPVSAPPTAPAGSVRVCLRRDLGAPAWGGADAEVCAPSGLGVERLVDLIRDRLLPPDMLADLRPWRFWEPGRPAP